MTLATANAQDLSIARISLLAFRQASIVGPYQGITQEQQSWASDLLDVLVNETHTRGAFAKAVAFETIELQQGIFKYTVSADALDIIGPAMFIDNTQTNLEQATAETPVTPMVRDEWQTLSTKSASARPQRYYLHRELTPPEIYLWPVPSASEHLAHIRFEKHRLRRTNSDASKTMDFEQYWHSYFVYRLAQEIAFSSAMPMERVSYLAKQAGEALAYCSGAAKQRPPQQLVFFHSTRWS